MQLLQTIMQWLLHIRYCNKIYMYENISLHCIALHCIASNTNASICMDLYTLDTCVGMSVGGGVGVENQKINAIC